MSERSIIRDALARSELFPTGQLGPDADSLAAGARLQRVPASSVLVEEGQVPEEVHIVDTGRFVVSTRFGLPPIQITAGDLIGEIGLLDGEAASGTVRAARDSSVITLPAAQVRSLLLSHPELLLRLATIVAGRVRTRNRGTDAVPPRLVTVYGDADGSLRAAIADRVEGSRLASATADLETIEREHIVLVDGDAVPVPADTEIVLRRPGSAAIPVRAARRIEVAEHSMRGLLPGSDLRVNIDRSDDSTVDRLVRLVFGGARVIVFSGGGARAGAHLGFYDEMRRAGSTFDAVIGVSAGAMMAAAVAADWTTAEMERRLLQSATTISWWRDLGPTGEALTTGRSLTAAARSMMGAVHLEDLRLPCLICAMDLCTGTLATIDSGPAWQAVRASGALPGIVPPVRRGDEVLVDGGALDNLPTSLAYDLLPRPHVTAVDVGRDVAIHPDDFGADGVAHRRRLFAGGSQLARVITSSLVGRRDVVRCDELIEPDVDDIPLLDMRFLDRAVERGRAAAVEHLRLVGTDVTE